MIPYFKEPRIIQERNKFLVCYRQEIRIFHDFEMAYLYYKTMKVQFGFERMVGEHYQATT